MTVGFTQPKQTAKLIAHASGMEEVQGKAVKENPTLTLLDKEFKSSALLASISMITQFIIVLDQLSDAISVTM